MQKEICKIYQPSFHPHHLNPSKAVNLVRKNEQKILQYLSDNSKACFEAIKNIQYLSKLNIQSKNSTLSLTSLFIVVLTLFI